MDIFSERLKWLREKKGMTQKEVADFMGVSQQYYGRFEKGQGEPNLSAFATLRTCFDEPLEFLLGIYDLDNQAATLFEIVRTKRKEYFKYLQRMNDLIDMLKTEEAQDKEIRQRIFDAIREDGDNYSEKHEYEKAKEYFLEYFSTIPGITEEKLTDDYLDEMFDYMEDSLVKAHDAYIRFYNRISKREKDS